MDKYHDEQLYDILSARAKWGLDEDVITDDRLYRVADAVAGDARLAIGILRTAAGKANRENHERITDDILLDAAPRMPGPRSSRRASTRSRRTSASSTTSFANTARSGRAKSTSDIPEEVDDPRTKRTIRTYLSKMEQYNLPQGGRDEPRPRVLARRFGSGVADAVTVTPLAIRN